MKSLDVKLLDRDIFTISNMFEYLMENIEEIGLEEKDIKRVLKKIHKAKVKILKDDK